MIIMYSYIHSEHYSFVLGYFNIVVIQFEIQHLCHDGVLYMLLLHLLLLKMRLQ